MRAERAADIVRLPDDDDAPGSGAFFHLAKCGGISVRLLAERCGRLLWVTTRASRRGHRFGMNRVPCLADMPAERRRALFVFTIVRNPFERFVSCWQMFRQRPQRGSYRGSFADFVDLATNPAIPDTAQPYHLASEQWDASPECMRYHMVPQTRRLGELAEELGRAPDYVARLERIDVDWNTISCRLGFDAPLPHRNRTAHHHYSAYYDRRTLQKVADYCAEDLRALGYRFEPRYFGVRRTLLVVPGRVRALLSSMLA
jgi:hypothetical protein